MFLTDDQKQTVKVLFNIISILEAKRPYAQGHSRRVAELSRQVVEELGVEEDEVGLIFVAALLHDIGYLALPERLFEASDPLGQAERELLKSHSKVGIHILGKARYLTRVRDIILQHHFRYDGRGNPDGIRGREITLGARIIFLVETFEALTKPRPHRAGLPVLKAFQEIKRDKGRFDPELIKVFRRVLERRLGGPLNATLSQQELEQRLERARTGLLRAGAPLPLAPEALGLIERLLREGKATINLLSGVVESRPDLASMMITVANSPLYGAPAPITKFAETLVRLGLAEARDVLAALIYWELFREREEQAGPLLDEWWEFSLLTGIAARNIAQRSAPDLKDLAFPLGLLHGLGKPCFLRAFLSDWPGGRLEPVQREALTEFIDRHHRAVGEGILTKAGFQERIIKAVKSYGLSSAGGLAPESLLLNAAVDVVSVIRSGQGTGAAGFEDLVSTALLGLVPQDMEEVARETIELWDRLKRYLPLAPAGEED